MFSRLKDFDSIVTQEIIVGMQQAKVFSHIGIKEMVANIDVL